MKTKIYFYMKDKKERSYFCNHFIEHETSYEVNEGNWHHIQRIIGKKYPKDRIVELYNEEMEAAFDQLRLMDIVEAIPVYITHKSSWVDGIYFSENLKADTFIQGRARKIEYSNNFMLFNIEYSLRGSEDHMEFWTNLYSDGKGATFEPYEKVNIVRW